ncbi:thermonuclease family protein (plasmid) [Roseibium aggregatum]|uniref:thermonuclease family protein n=1 Tax=Roseibium aggregatum TaxID=187304 RepID=UPI001E294B49|nr:thermonuclease family protein [Roseibium aggregatum]UES60246.1 thermonuclease family protein [Roseibium aggregatum]
MNAHLVISVLLCAATCETEQLRIWDGDSFLVGMQSGSERIRIQNIDAPEIDGQCIEEIRWADRAKFRLADIMNGSRIEIARSGKDKYGRTLARVSVNGIDAGGILISESLARPWEGRRQPWC